MDINDKTKANEIVGLFQLLSQKDRIELMRELTKLVSAPNPKSEDNISETSLDG